ncbi:uncharacterized protein LOC133906329 [Phragmites australis]|uniref:uncharacterized protein LOC133906329 n=1 Tax=Phragmites australis TaxID=29695 RepID=UPI002D79C5CE|nr:uncharacterized protein LOC133906329 [Phragmites australis]
MASRNAVDSPRSVPRRQAVAPKDGGGGGLLSPRFRSAAALAGWDEESVLLAALVVEDTPVRESRRKRRSSTSGGGSAGSSTRKRRSRRQSGGIPQVVLALDDDEKPGNAADGKKEGEGAKEGEEEKVVVAGNEGASGSGGEAAAAGNLPCMDQLREELSCAICLEICFEPSTTPCGHSFCMKCLKHAAAKCGKRCPKCRQLISNSRSCTVNTVLWNTIQLLFPSEVEARRISIASSSLCNDNVNQSPPRSTNFSQGGMRTRNSGGSFITEGRTRSSYRSFVTPSSNTRSSSTSGSFITTHGGGTRGSSSRRGFVPASQLVSSRSSVRSDQSDDATLAYRLQQEEFMNAFETEEERPPQNTVSTARENLRAMASRAIRLRARGWPV